jgi:hypothetical protein
MLFHWRQQFPWWKTMGRWLVPLVIVTAAAAFTAYGVASLLMADTLNRPMLLGDTTLAGLSYCVVFVVLGQVIGLWTAEDRALLGRVLAIVRRHSARAG